VNALNDLMYIALHIVSTTFLIMVYDTSRYALSIWCPLDAKKHPSPPTTYSGSKSIKIAVFGAASTPSVLLLVDSIRGTQQLLWLIPYISMIYTSLDMAALMVLKDMYLSTTIHHITVQFLYMYIALNDFDQDKLARPMVMFVCFSCPLFLPVCRFIGQKLCPSYTVSLSPMQTKTNTESRP